MKSSPLTPEEAAAVRFYEGDLTCLPAADPFYADSRAFVSLNALLFPGLGSEITRIREGKRLNPAVLADLPRLTALYSALLSAAKKGAQPRQRESWRVERAEDFAQLAAAGQTLSFTSTSLGGFLPAYGDKQGIVLMHFTVPAMTPCIVMAELLDNYAKADEQELLLPPFLTFSASERALTDAERQITDQNGRPPAAVYEIALTGQYAAGKPAARPCRVSAQAVSVWAQLNAGTDPAELPQAAAESLRRFKERLTAWVHSIAIFGE